MAREWKIDATTTPHALGSQIQAILMVNPNIIFSIRRVGEFIIVETTE